MEDERNKHYLKQAIKGLVTHDGPDLWEEVEGKLVSTKEKGREHLGNAIDLLEEKKAPELWHAIEQNLSEGDDKTNYQWSKVMGVAAAVACLFIGYFLIDNVNDDDKTIEVLSYSSDEVILFDFEDEKSFFESKESAVLGFIERNCKVFASKCNNTEFKGLYDTYQELNEAQTELQLQMKKTPHKARLMKYLIRVKKHKTETAKEMMKLFKYS